MNDRAFTVVSVWSLGMPGVHNIFWVSEHIRQPTISRTVHDSHLGDSRLRLEDEWGLTHTLPLIGSDDSVGRVPAILLGHEFVSHRRCCNVFPRHTEDYKK